MCERLLSRDCAITDVMLIVLVHIIVRAFIPSSPSLFPSVFSRILQVTLSFRSRYDLSTVRVPLNIAGLLVLCFL